MQCPLNPASFTVSIDAIVESALFRSDAAAGVDVIRESPMSEEEILREFIAFPNVSNVSLVLIELLDDSTQNSSNCSPWEHLTADPRNYSGTFRIAR